MRSLFISRTYSSKSVGGMQRQSFLLIRYISQITDTETKIIHWPYSQLFFPFFLIYAFFKSSYFLFLKRIDLIHLGDALLTPLGCILKFFFQIPVAITIHGLDVIFPNFLYQKIIVGQLQFLDGIICVSQATQKECIKRGVPLTKTKVIGNCTNLFPLRQKKSLDSNFKCKKILLSVGRPIKRKGFSWFTENVFLQLELNVVYLIAGELEKNIINILKV